MTMKIALFALLAMGCWAGGSCFAGGKSFVGQDLPGKDFSGQSLPKADFTDANLRDAKFNGANLKNAIFRDAILGNAYFNDAEMSGADMRGIKAGANFQNTNLSKSNWEGSQLSYGTNCNFREANLKKIKITGTLSKNDFRGADLCGANIRGATFHTDPRQANLFKGAFYDEDTTFPKGFDPEAEKLILRKVEKKDEKKADKCHAEEEKVRTDQAFKNRNETTPPSFRIFGP